MIIIGPGLNTGIGQHALKYSKLFGRGYYLLGDKLPEAERGLVFMLPVRWHMEYLTYIRTRVKDLQCMTVCETQTVHPDYGLLFKEFEQIAVPSEFCKSVFSSQFPDTQFYVVRAHIPTPPEKPYVFYHIGNIQDPRKQFREILRAFIRLNESNTRLVVKATCKKDIDIQIPRVTVINGVIPEENMNELHDTSDCYVSFSHSEGVGLGAVEAAMRDKPVIITDYGGAPEYVKTPYLIDCETQKLEEDDFLFQKGMEWGKPNFNQLLNFMRDAYEKRLRYMDHTHTKRVVSGESVKSSFFSQS
tara:strand:- start:2099 stop:3004 length:906 start_codon:yes stop_codon:yes gene_type:complete